MRFIAPKRLAATVWKHRRPSLNKLYCDDRISSLLRKVGEDRLPHENGWRSESSLCPSEHDPEKWIPVFRKDHVPPKIQSATSIQLKAIALQRHKADVHSHDAFERPSDRGLFIR